jgi:hypothetical protein
MMGVGCMAMAKRGARGKSKDDLSGLFGLSCWLDRQTHQANQMNQMNRLSGMAVASFEYIEVFYNRTRRRDAGLQCTDAVSG